MSTLVLPMQPSMSVMGNSVFVEHDTRITVAPNAAHTRPMVGAAMARAKSKTLIPESGRRSDGLAGTLSQDTAGCV